MTRRLAPERDGDAGVTLLEVVVALAVIAAALASLLAFFVRAVETTRVHTDRQAATRYAVVAMERVSLLPGTAVLVNRPHAAVQAQWSRSRPPQVDALLAATRTEMAWSAQTAAVEGLPTAPERVTDGGAPTKFTRHWYVGRCWQQPTGGDCVVVPAAQRPARVAMFRVVVAVQWASADCDGGQCFHVESMLANVDRTDPAFE
ncbi:prepilin-type N-terminal cleavage/methylation domain-containing protein [Spirilliplanes yamanashiensis]|uniref:Prepilin-type N-terminal cleavage/methylation domain-containing protein n=1 Tax=Spirilliplanes yamanashiensis TaxID=42233 RepID=A0A8J3YEA1_9ACTN|nr:prepilin-type N-terminal cleavage/methylation domain-containing protein [Spirilliplanes yamanashiensis]MDP9815247.1 prepilin-type N-terminal cleavage/methylation domain-containing protein [Spirilliplanes yamanashiensis]GIJ06484.1 hypothetical protein Sya03_58360 [Spirilliplanes yamanashiensis]